jgi:hypothetical protein
VDQAADIFLHSRFDHCAGTIDVDAILLPVMAGPDVGAGSDMKYCIGALGQCARERVCVSKITKMYRNRNIADVVQR